MVKLPEAVKRKIEDYKELDFTMRSQVASAIGLVSLPSSLKGLVSDLQTSTNLPVEVIQLVVDVGVELHRGMLALEQTPEVFGKEIAEPEGPPELAAEFLGLLTSRALAMLAKYREIGSDYEKTYLDSSVYSDIRPLFLDRDQTPVGLCVRHNLVIEHSHGVLPKKTQITLDSEDLEKLASQIERARAKEKSLREHLVIPECRWME